MPRLSATEAYRWQPEKSPSGPLSIVISGADQRVLVYRNGVEIGRAKVAMTQPNLPLGTHAFIMQEGPGKGRAPSRRAPGAPLDRGRRSGSRGRGQTAPRSVPRQPGSHARGVCEGRLRHSDARYHAAGYRRAGARRKTTGVALNVMNADAPRMD